MPFLRNRLDPAVLYVPFTDTFSVAEALSVSGWSAFNGSAVSISKSGGQYRTGTISSVGSTTWFNTDRGRADWKLVKFPVTGESDVEIIATNVGVGPSANPANNLTSSAWALAGLIVHLEDTSGADYEFLVAGRVNGGVYIESKTTTAGVSEVDTTSVNPVGSGVTHADLRLLLRSDRTVRWAYRPPNTSDGWTAIDFGHGSGVSDGGGRTFTSGAAWVGLITYAYDSVPASFVGTCDALTRTGE